MKIGILLTRCFLSRDISSFLFFLSFLPFFLSFLPFFPFLSRQQGPSRLVTLRKVPGSNPARGVAPDRGSHVQFEPGGVAP